MIKNDSVVSITYVKNKVTQTVRMVSKEYYDVIVENRKLHSMMSNKQQKEFERDNIIKLEFDEVVENSPLGLAIMNNKSLYGLSDLCIMDSICGISIVSVILKK